MFNKLNIDPTLPAQRSSSAVRDGVFQFRFHWNTRMSSWFLDISNSQGTLLIGGIRVVVNNDLLAQYEARAGAPQFGLLAINFKEPGVDPGRYDLGDSVQVFYADENFA